MKKSYSIIKVDKLIEMTMIYTLEQNDNIDDIIEEEGIIYLFGQIFIENNFDNCKME